MGPKTSMDAVWMGEILYFCRLSNPKCERHPVFWAYPSNYTETNFISVTASLLLYILQSL
jgi:hypothetical protein